MCEVCCQCHWRWVSVGACAVRGPLGAHGHVVAVRRGPGHAVRCGASIRDRRSGSIRDAAGADMLYGVGALAFRGAPGAGVGAPCHPSRERVILLSFLFYFFCATLRRRCVRLRPAPGASAAAAGADPAPSRPDATAATALAPGPGGQLGERRGAGRRRRYAFGASATVAFAPRRPSLLFWVCLCAPLAHDSRIVACLMLLAAPRRFPSAVAVQVAVQSHARGGPAARVMSSRRRR